MQNLNHLRRHQKWTNYAKRARSLLWVWSSLFLRLRGQYTHRAGNRRRIRRQDNQPQQPAFRRR